MIDTLKDRSSCCELCAAEFDLQVLTVEQGNSTNVDDNALIFAVCKNQISPIFAQW